MKVTVALEFNFKTIKIDINGLINNAKIHFESLAINLAEPINGEDLCKYVFEQVQQTGIGSFLAQKNDIPFEVIIYWTKNKLEVKSLNDPQPLLEFYVYRCMEICQNFAILELQADEFGMLELGKHLESSY